MNSGIVCPGFRAVSISLVPAQVPPKRPALEGPQNDFDPYCGISLLCTSIYLSSRSLFNLNSQNPTGLGLLTVFPFGGIIASELYLTPEYADVCLGTSGCPSW